MASINQIAYEKFRRMIVEARLKAGMTQTDVARKLGRRQTWVSKYETGERRIDIAEFIEIAAAMDLDPVSFLKRLLR